MMSTSLEKKFSLKTGQDSIENDITKPYVNKTVTIPKEEPKQRDEEEIQKGNVFKKPPLIDFEEENDSKNISEITHPDIFDHKGSYSESSQRSNNTILTSNSKSEIEGHRQQVRAILEKLKDPKELLEAIKKYQCKNKDFNITELKASSHTKIKRYKDSVYLGEIINNLRHGKGIMFYADTRTYEGEWENDIKHGKGLELLASGNRYEGNFLNGKPEGIGTFTWPNGEAYEGEWKNGLKHGSGMWKGSRGETYFGEWKNGKVDGYGVHTWKNGDRYEGEMKSFLKHGHGTERFTNGDFYIGNYINGKPDGYGEYYWANGSVYKGHFKNGLRHGKGVWKKGADSQDVYDGEWFNDKKSGQGTYTWASGNYYKGEYFDDLRHGYGEMYWNDGSYYKGNWEKGIQHGQGELMIPGQPIQKGIFVNNVLVQEPKQNKEPRSINHSPERVSYESVPYLSGSINSSQFSEFPEIRRITEKVKERSHSHAVASVVSSGHNHSFERQSIRRKDPLPPQRNVVKLEELNVRPNRNFKRLKEVVNPQGTSPMRKRTLQPIWRPTGKNTFEWKNESLDNSFPNTHSIGRPLLFNK